MLDKRWKKFTLAGFVAAFLISFIILPLIAQRYIEKNSETMTGRIIRMHDIDVNLLTGCVSIEKPMIFERDKQLIFFQAEELYVNAAPSRMITRYYVEEN